MNAMRTTLILLFIFCVLSVKAQDTRIITGRVTVLNDLPISGITVKAKKSKAAASTDSIGMFTIACYDNDCIVFSSKSFSTAKHKVNRRTKDTISVKLHFTPTEQNLDMAIGYGYISEANRTQAIEYIKNGPNYCSYRNIYELIRAHFNGIYIRSDGCIIVRGPNTINASPCATYVVDGKIVDTIDFIPTCDVKEISLLKDGSAAIYGSQSANGVIIINLKDGRN